MSISGKTLFHLTQTLRRSKAYDLYRENERTPFEKREVLQKSQWDQLKRILRNAQENVPYYTEMFSHLGITAEDIRSPADFSALPLLTKEVLQTRGDDLISRRVDRQSLIKHSSGGSTGVPVSFYHDRAVIDASDAAVYRYLHHAGWRPGDWIGFFLGFTKRMYELPRWNFELRQRLRRMYQFDAHKASEEEMEKWFRTYSRLKPKVAHGFPSTIARFAGFVKESGRTLPAVSGVCTTAEALLPQQRALIEEVLGGKVYDCYGSSEVRNIATECDRGRMHVNTDYVYLEQQSSDAGAQPLIVTSLKSFSMPFIRYLNLDEGMLLDGTCDCGRGFPLMHLEIGRTNDHFRFPGGEVVHGLTLTHQFYGSEGVASFQYHQTALHAVSLYVVPGPGSEEGRSAAISKAVAKLQSLSREPLTIDVQLVKEIPRTLAGKHRFTRSDVAIEASGG